MSKLQTDSTNYIADTTASINASGFDPNSMVELTVDINGGLSSPFTWFVRGSALGALQTSFFVNPAYAGATLQVMATEVNIGSDGTVTPVAGVAPATTDVSVAAPPAPGQGPVVNNAASLEAALASTGVTVLTDQADYLPGSTANITATGFGAGDDIRFSSYVIDPTTGAALSVGPVWDATAGSNGSALTHFSVPSAYLNELTAVDTVTGQAASTIFADGSPQNIGQWSSVFSWPLIGLHCIMTPDGKILTYGTDQNGVQSGLHLLDIWNPITNQHTTIENTTHTDEFCSVGLIVPETGQVLISGGDGRPVGNYNGGVADVNFYDPATMTENPSSTGPMQFARWYGSAVQLASGQILLIGGRDDSPVSNTPAHFSAYPEVYTPGYGFHTLTGAYINSFNITALYPRSWLTSSGAVWTFSDGTADIYAINTTGVGSVQRIGSVPTALSWYQPTIMFAPDKVLIIGNDDSAWIMDMSGPTPVFQRTDDASGGRIWSNLVVLPDGRVMLSGGSSVYNELTGVSYTAEIWDPTTGHWTMEADAAVPRLYHSDTILLADGSILSLGGGAPGPLSNLNGEIYKPDYLFNATGAPAVRPVIEDAPKSVLPGAEFTMHVDNPASIKELALMPFGAVTHSFDMSARRFQLPFTVKADGSLVVDLPSNPNLLTPGYWMLFAINNNDTPSIAATVQVKTPLLYDLPAQLPLDLLDANMTLLRNGDAAYDAYNDRYVLTPDAANKDGSFISPQRVDLSAAFDLQFQINLGSDPTGGDGVGFLFHNDLTGVNALGAGGSGQGLKGIQNGVGIEFATNAATDYTAFVKTADDSTLSTVMNLSNIEDGQWHLVDVASDGQNLSYTFDGVRMGSMALSAAETLLGSNFAYFGFTGETSAAAEQEQIQLLKLVTKTAAGTQVDLERASLPQPVQFVVNGSAAYNASSKSYTVTPDTQLQDGSVMATSRVDLSKAFKLTFDINLGNKANGADGMGFVLDNDPLGPHALGDSGGGMGLMGIKNGIGIEFDTYKNAEDPTDIADDHTNFLNTGTHAALSAVYDLGTIKDGLWHRVAIVSDGQTISYTFDGVQMGTLSLASVDALLGGTSLAYWGFTGATGGLSEQQQVRLVKMEGTAADGTDEQIVGPNHDPVAVNDAYTVDENGVLTVSATNGVLANDYDPDGDPLRICPESRVIGHALLLSPTDGTVKMNVDGSFTYTPNAGFSGVDSFYYCTEDGPACVQGRVDITVLAAGNTLDPTFTVNGSAVNTATNMYMLTPNTQIQHGSVMSDMRIDLSKTFDITFDINVGNNPNGADGMGFVLQNDPLGHNALGDAGGGMGMMGIKNGIGIEFDTYDNADDPTDIADDHTNFLNTGTHAALSAVHDLGTIKDGQWHHVHVVSDGQTLSYTFDGAAMSSLSDATAESYLGSQFAYFGFTGGTGGQSEPEQVRLIGLNATAENGTPLLVTQQPTFTLNGTAINTSPQVYTLTPDAAVQHGSVMSDMRVDLSKKFDITFDIDVGNKPNGADGEGFVLQNDPLGHNALGDAGGGMGMMGIKNGIGIEFDTYDNADDPTDIADDHTNFLNTGTHAALSAAHDLGTIKDGQWHQVHVVSDGQTLSYTFDGAAISSLSDATAESYLGSQFAYFGFTGATGGLSEPEQVRLIGLNATAENGALLQVSGGGTGTDRIISGAGGNHTLTGCPIGNDTFVFAPGFGADTITDFSRAVGNRDIIDLTAFHFASGADALSHAVANGADTVFNFGNGDALTVQHTAAGNVTNLLVDDLRV